MSYRVLCTQSNTIEWLALRKCGIGASEAAAILGDTKWGTPLTVWQDKRNPEVTDIGNERMRWGHRMEAVIVEAIAEEFPEIGEILPSEGLLQSIEHPHLLGTLDARVDSPDYGIVPLEIKNVSAFMKKDWYDEFGAPHVPPKYTIQVRQQAFITGAPGGWVGVLFDGNELEVIWVPQSEEFVQNHLLGTLKDYWHINVIGGKTPDPIMGDDLASMWPVTPKATTEADDLFLEMVERWRDAKARESTAKADIEALRFYFEAYMILDGEDRTAQFATHNGKNVFELRPRRGQQRVNVKTHTEQHPDCADCVTRDRTSHVPYALGESA
jgi:putative phage-type endonuclease